MKGRGRLRMVAIAFLGATLCAGSVMATDVHAQLSTCYDDPVVLLSDGSAVSMSVTVSDTTTDILGVSYTLHVPQKLTVKGVFFAGTIPSRLQSLTVVADGKAGQYGSDTVVNTHQSGIAVTASTSVVDSSGNHGSGSAHGHNHDRLHVDVRLQKGKG